MRKVATLFNVLCAVGASFALATAASALPVTISIQGSNLPGTNTYDIVMTWVTADNVNGFATSVTTNGTYTGAFTETIPGGFAFAVLPGPGPIAVGTGIRGAWAGANGGAVAGGTFTVGTVTITVADGNTVNPFFTLADGVVDGADNLLATTFSGVTIIPEPTTASLLGLGLVGLFMVGRRSRS